MDLQTIGRLIKKFREKRGYTQEELAKLAGISYTTLMKIEQNQVEDPRVKTLKKIAKALNVTIDELTTDE